MKYCFGVDVGGTTVKIGLFKNDGLLIKKWEIRTRVENEGKEIIPDIASSIKSYLLSEGISEKEVIGIGLGIPAPITEEGVIEEKTSNLGWKRKNVKEEFENYIRIPVEVGNDANIAALGEMWLGAGRGKKNIIMVTLGTGVGGGILTGGRLLRGAWGSGGEIGHICVNYEETRQCGCGKRGCLEQYASATGIARMAGELLKDTDAETLLSDVNRERRVTARDVFDAAKKGDKVALQVVEQFGRYLGRALANIAAIIDPEVVIIGGGVSRAGTFLLEYIEKNYYDNCFYSNKNVEFALAQLENDAGICGGARLML